MATIRLFGGKDHPVSAAWHARHVAPHEGLDHADYDALEREKSRLKALWDRRAAMLEAYPDGSTDENPLVHHDERARVNAIDAIQAAHKKARHLAGRQPSAFGFEGIDQINPVRHLAACGCVMIFALDAKGVRRPLSASRRCGVHLLHADLDTHQAAVLADTASD